jgi:transcriptional regulator with XRE-family HTH domain
MSRSQSVADWMADQGVTLDALERASGLDRRVLTAIVNGRYTPSPAQRERVAAALGIAKEQIAWGHTNEVTHLYGHGPQFGRTP